MNEEILISKQDFEKYFNCRRVITKDELEKYYKKKENIYRKNYHYFITLVSDNYKEIKRTFFAKVLKILDL